MTSTIKLSPNMQGAMWERSGATYDTVTARFGAYAYYMTRPTRAALRDRGLLTDGTGPAGTQLTEHGRAWITDQIEAAHAEALDMEWSRTMIRLDWDDAEQVAQFGSWYESRLVEHRLGRRDATHRSIRQVVDLDHDAALAIEAGLLEFVREWDVAALAEASVTALVPVYSLPWYEDRPVVKRAWRGPGLA